MADNNNNISVNNRSNLLSLINTNQDDHHVAMMMVMKEQLQQHSSSSTIHGAAEQLILPIANVGRMMKEGLPRGAKVSKEAKETMQECATEFISFVTAEASGRCRRDRRKTLNGDDVLWALQALGFDDYTAPLGRYLHRYRQLADADGPHVRERAANAAVDGNNGGSEEY